MMGLDTRAIIFDMDNTLLQSRIDFARMRQAVYLLLLEDGMISEDFQWSTHTPSQIIEAGRTHPRFSSIEKRLWEKIEEIETQGMDNISLEPYAAELLHYLQRKNIHTFILTNNALKAAEKALRTLNIFHFFDDVICRDHMTKLKPSADGVFYILNKYPRCNREQWLFVGDSWIDGKAATDAGVPFLSYKGDINQLQEKGVQAIGVIDSLSKLLDWIG